MIYPGDISHACETNVCSAAFGWNVLYISTTVGRNPLEEME